MKRNSTHEEKQYTGREIVLAKRNGTQEEKQYT